MSRSRRGSTAVTLRTLIALGAAIALASVAATRASRPKPDASTAARALENLVRERAAALSARTSTLSDLPRLAAAVATDAATMRDLTGEELAFRPRPGEVIAVTQLFRDGKRLPLLTLPEGSAALVAPAEAGLEARIAGGVLALLQTTKIVPAARVDELSGLLTVLWPLSAAELGSAALASTDSAVLELGGSSLRLGPGGANSADDAWVSAPVHLPGDTGQRARLSVRIPAAGGGRIGWWIGAGLLAVVASLSWLAGKRARPVDADVGRAADPAASTNIAGTTVPPRGTAILPPSSVVTEASGLPHTAVFASPSGFTVPGPVPPATIPYGVTAALHPTPTVGDRIGRYVIVRPLGQGGMAEVFLARAEGEAGFEKLVAVKVLQATFAANPGVVDLFLDEARVAAGLNHPNIVQTYDLGRAGDRYFIAMEYVDGPDLSQLLTMAREQGERVPVPIALGILCRICDGLHAAHTAAGPDGQPLSLIHRDVKSANVFVSRTGSVKVGDFGIAKATHAMRVSRTEIGLVKGTPGYMAPEQRLGQEVDERVDVYGVGAIAYEILSGMDVNLDFAALAARGLVGWPHLAPLARTRNDVPEGLEQLITRSLSYARDDRPRDCLDLERALRAAGAVPGLADDKAIGAWTRQRLERGGATVAATRVAGRRDP